MKHEYQRAADAIRGASGLLIGAGAGMGVDSGLPDFRGNEGFWKAYPPFRGRRFAEMSTPHWFRTDPALAWGFFGHRLHLYRSAVPHAGFALLLKWIHQFGLDAFVFTSNVDGQFHKAGFDPDIICECHGSIHHLQCTGGCSEIWSAAEVRVDVDMDTIRARGSLPSCPSCDSLARPNILMFNDASWLDDRTSEQSSRLARWHARQNRIVAIEIGAGLAIPTVRQVCEQVGEPLIRINPRECDVAENSIGLTAGALEALQGIDSCLGEPTA